MANSTAKRTTEVKNVVIPESTKSTAEIHDMLIRARISMLINAPFFGSIATKLRFIDATKWCPTAATDGRNFYYNRNFVDYVNSKSEDMLVFLAGHEVLHCVYDHMDKNRLGTRDPRLANMAQDYVINNDLVEASIGKKIDFMEICYDWKHRGKFWEEIYDELFKQAEEEGRVVYVDTLDMHIDPESQKGEGGDNDAPGEGNNDGSEGPIKYSEEELEQIKNEVQTSVLQAARVAAGNMPQGVKRLVDAFTNPQLDWREIIAMQIQSVIKNDYTMAHPNRKGRDEGIYLPGMNYDETIDIAIALDMSGSILDDMARDFLSEVKGCMDQYTNFRIHLFCFDTEVHNPQDFTESNMDELMSYELAGGGGTDFMSCWRHFGDTGIVPKKFIMFTDGYPWDSWGDESYCDTLFIVHGGNSGDHPVAPFGITVPYTRED